MKLPHLVRTARVPLLLIGVLAAGVIGLGYDIARRTREVVMRRAETEAAQASVESFFALRRDNTLIEPRLADIRALIPSRDALVSFSHDMTLLGAAAHVTVTVSFRGELGRQGSAAASSLTATDFSAIAEGTLSNLIAFLDTVRTSKYLVTVTTLDFTRAQGNNFRASIGGTVLSL